MDQHPYIEKRLSEILFKNRTIFLNSIVENPDALSEEEWYVS